MNTKEKYYLLSLFLIIFSIFFSWNCDLVQPLPENPYDPQYPDYFPPRTVIISGPSGLVSNKSVTFTWRQKNAAYNPDSLDAEKYGEIEYRYRLNEGMWSPWSSETSVTFEFLDEQEYLFEVMSKYPTNVLEDVPYPKKSFTMDAYHSSLIFFPRMTIIPSWRTDRSFTVSVVAEEVENLLGVKIIVNYDPNYLELLDWKVLKEEGSFLRQNAGDILDFVDDTHTGWIAFDLAVVMGDSLGITGSGELIQLTFELPDSSSAGLNLDETCSLRNIHNEEILQDRGDGVVYVW